jgi:Rieske Fe-S protein
LNKHPQAQSQPAKSRAGEPQPAQSQPAQSQPAQSQPAQASAPGRRALLFGATVVGAATLAGCTTYDANGNGGFLGNTAASTPSASSSGGTGAASSSAALATIAEVPEGGGKIIDGKNIVITQPEAGVFKAFSAVCTHQGCIVSSIANGTIDCPCHGSEFSVKDGSVVRGPATSPLPGVAIKIEGTSIVQA